MQSFKGRSFLTLLDFTPEEIKHLLDLAHQTKKDKRAGIISNKFQGKNLAMIFEKRSTRTRCAFETSFSEEAGHPVFLSNADIQLGAKESVEDTAQVLGRMFDAIMFRGFSQSAVETLAQKSGVPVFNGLTDSYHPTQILADFMTIEEELGELKGKKIVFIGDGLNNVAISLMIGCAKMGAHFSVVAPTQYTPKSDILELVAPFAKESGAQISVTTSILEGVQNADVIYTDVWTSMGEEAIADKKEAILKPYQVNKGLMEATGNKNALFLHCLPAVKGKEVTEEVFDSPNSKVFEEAENRKWTIKAVMLACINGE